jgi:hypothetical protein
MARGKPEPVRITSASRSHSEDLWAREKRYMVTMGIRTACFVLGVGFYLSPAPKWICVVFIIGSLVLPYIAVVMANAGASADPDRSEPFDPHSDRQAIETGREEDS